MFRRTVVGISALVLAFGVAESDALADDLGSICKTVGAHAQDTVIVFQPPAAFTVCRDGSVERGVVTDRPVYLELAPSSGPRMFDFRIRGKPGDFTPYGFGGWEALISRIASVLGDLDHSGQTVADLQIPLDGSSAPTTPLRALAAARATYLADVTPRYIESLHSVRGDVRELRVIAGVVRRWCATLGTEVAGVLMQDAELRPICASPELTEQAVDHALDEFEAAATKEGQERRLARDAARNAIAHPDDQKATAEGIRALDDARAAATSVVSSAHALRELSRVLGRGVSTLKVTLRSLDALRPGVPTYLATYSTPGNAELEVEVIPNDITAVGAELPKSLSAGTIGRYPIAGRHYLDLELGLGWAVGADEPYTTVIQANTVIQTKPVQDFVGLAMVELEPLRFLWPERPAAGLLRLPVIGVPFTKDPTANFFIGAGLGWTGVGSVTAGPYLLRQKVLRDGFAENEIVPPGVALGGITETALRVGYYVSASIDLVGVFHLFIPPHSRTIDGLTGKEK